MLVSIKYLPTRLLSAPTQLHLSVTWCDLGIYVDVDLSLRIDTRPQDGREVFRHPSPNPQHSTVSTRPVLESQVVSFVLSWLDYGSATLAGLPSPLLGRLQSVQNAAARLIFSDNHHVHMDHITPLLRSLHWLRVPERITFRLAVLVYRCLHGLAAVYLSADLVRASNNVGLRQRLRSATSALEAVGGSAVGHITASVPASP